jgi:hypothetical protein
MRKLSLAISALLFAGASFAASSVATINVSNGSVLVNQGKHFVTAQPGQILAAGDRVMVMEGGNAVVKYADGCVQTLGSGSLAVVAAQSVCASGLNQVAQISPVNAQAVGELERDCDKDGIPDSKDGDIDGDDVLNASDLVEACKAGATTTNNTGIWIVAGLAAAGAAVLISDGDDETISP